MANILIVTGSALDKKLYEAFLEVKESGHKLYLLSDGHFQPVPDIFQRHFIHDLRKTKEILMMLKDESIHFDAVTLQFSDWLTPLVALVAEQYDCIGNSPQTAFCCRSKYHMRKKLQKAGVPIPQFRLCKNYDDIKSAVEEVGVPCIAKPIGANGSYGVFGIMNESDITNLEENYKSSINFLKKKSIADDIFTFTPAEFESMGIYDNVDMATDYLIEEYMDGPEISVDAMVQNGKITIMGIEDQIRMSPPYFLQIAGRMPYMCDKKRMQEIKNIIEKTIKAMGIENSATHTEIIFTSEGPKIVEIGCRFGGDDIHDKILAITGYNLMFESIMIALGIPRIYEIQPKCHTYMEYLLPRIKGVLESISLPDEFHSHHDILETFLFSKKGDKVAPPPDSFDFLGYVVTKGATPEEAEKTCKKIMEQIQVVIT